MQKKYGFDSENQENLIRTKETHISNLRTCLKFFYWGKMWCNGKKIKMGEINA